MRFLPDKALLAVLPALALICLTIISAKRAFALDPWEIMVVVNDNSEESTALGRYYIEKRHVPNTNLFHVRCSVKETLTRMAFERDIATPIKRALLLPRFSKKIRCILLTYGIPLRILPDREGNGRNRKGQLPIPWTATRSAAVDSELMTIRQYGNYRLEGWLPNPWFIGGRHGDKIFSRLSGIMMVSRIDGPDLRTAKRIINDAIFAEAHGLSRKACLDCRYTESDRAKGRDAYHVFDRWIYESGLFLKSKGFDTVINQGPELIRKGECKDCALYCGWYSLGKYENVFGWAKGAIGYHIASAECVSLHGSNEQWCRMLLKKGASVTIGPVSEPYVQAFPPPNLFFRLLVDNGLCIARAYLMSSPMLSWQMILVGDPLYRPFLRCTFSMNRK